MRRDKGITSEYILIIWSLQLIEYSYIYKYVHILVSPRARRIFGAAFAKIKGQM